MSTPALWRELSQDAPPPCVGALLRKERERAELELCDVANATKIPLRVLEDLEQSRLEALPAPVFVRGFVKAYSRFLRIDEQGALEELDRTQLALERAKEPPPILPEPTGDRAMPLHPRRGFGVALFVLVIVMVVVAARWLGP